MSNIKNYLYNEKYSPSAEDMAEYELYCYCLEMKERMEQRTSLTSSPKRLEVKNEYLETYSLP